MVQSGMAPRKKRESETAGPPIPQPTEIELCYTEDDEGKLHWYFSSIDGDVHSPICATREELFDLLVKMALVARADMQGTA